MFFSFVFNYQGVIYPVYLGASYWMVEKLLSSSVTVLPISMIQIAWPIRCSLISWATNLSIQLLQLLKHRPNNEIIAEKKQTENLLFSGFYCRALKIL